MQVGTREFRGNHTLVFEISFTLPCFECSVHKQSTIRLHIPAGPCPARIHLEGGEDRVGVHHNVHLLAGGAVGGEVVAGLVTIDDDVDLEVDGLVFDVVI